MENPFSTDALVPVWKSASEILKYELAGHAFNGNQYTARSTGETRDALNSLRDRASQMAASAGKKLPTVSTMAHDRMARMHLEEAGRMRQLAASYHNPNGRSYAMEEGAAKLHEAAAAAHYAAADNPSAENTLKAADATMKATSGRNAGVTDGNVILSGAEKSFVTKGDVKGHEFHGNQYASNPFDKGFDHVRRDGAGWSALMAASHARDLVQHGGTGAQIANAHRAAAFEHGIASQVLKNALAKETNPEKQGALKSAIAAHDHAAELHNWVAEQHASGSTSPILRDNTMLARGASTVAENLSRDTGADTGAEFRNH